MIVQVALALLNMMPRRRCRRSVIKIVVMAVNAVFVATVAAVVAEQSDGWSAVLSLWVSIKLAAVACFKMSVKCRLVDSLLHGNPACRVYFSYKACPWILESLMGFVLCLLLGLNFSQP